MNKLIYSIFDNTKSNITREIEQLLSPFKNVIANEQYEEIRSLFFETGLIAEREGFVIEFEYAIQLILGCIHKD